MKRALLCVTLLLCCGGCQNDVQDGEPHVHKDDHHEHGHSHHHSHGHGHTIDYPSAVDRFAKLTARAERQLSPSAWSALMEEMYDLVRVLPELAADSDLKEEPWNRVYRASLGLEEIFAAVASAKNEDRPGIYKENMSEVAKLRQELVEVKQVFLQQIELRRKRGL